MDPTPTLSAAAASEPSPAPTISLVRRLSFWGFGTLIVLAVAFYLLWGISYGYWTDNGVYAVTITLLAFGLAGMWLVTPNPPTPAGEPP
ncbi:MAG: hypothetical protein L3J93_02720 [Thermoplasmata archaeon]|nr:hypothetical protein [Thermoplasmata archaeon]